jgi:predicted Zn-dependent peptidase
VKLVRRPQFPSVAAVLGFGGGAAASPAGVVELLRLLEHDGSIELRQNALQVQKVDGPDMTADMIVTGRRNLSNALLLLAARLRALDRIRWPHVVDEVQRKNIPVDHEAPAKKAARAFWRALYGNHSYARVISLAKLRHVEAREIVDWLPRVYNPRNATLVVAGDIDVPGAQSLVNAWFGSWRGVEDAGPLAVPPVPVPDASQPNEQVIVTHRPVANQVEVTLGCRLPGGSAPRDVAAARMLAGAVVGKLRARLREEGGAAYSVNGGASVLRGGGAHMVVAASIDNRKLREALKAIRSHWTHFAQGGFDRGTLSQVRWELVESENLAFQTSAETAVRVLEADNRGWPLAQMASLSDAYRNIGASDLQRLFTTCRATTVMSLLGDEATIRRALE